MLALEKWAIGRPRVLCILAHRIALAVPEFNKTSELARERAQSKTPFPLDEKVWSHLYSRDHWERRTGEVFNEMAHAHPESDGGKLEQLMQSEDVRALGLPNDWFPNPMLLLMCENDSEEVRELYESHISLVKANIAHPVTNAYWEKMLQNPEAVFFFCNVTPCLVEFGMSVHDLADRARSGDLDSLVRLLRLDKHCLVDEKVSSAYLRYLRNGTLAEKKRLTNAICDPLPRRPSIQKTVVQAGVKVYELFEEAAACAEDFADVELLRGCKLTYEDLLALFDAAYQDTSQDVSELYDDVRSFEQAVRRCLKERKTAA